MGKKSVAPVVMTGCLLVFFLQATHPVKDFEWLDEAGSKRDFTRDIYDRLRFALRNSQNTINIRYAGTVKSTRELEKGKQ